LPSVKWIILIVLAVIVIIVFGNNISNISKLNEKNSESTLISDEKNKNANPYVKEYSLPHGTWPNGILVDKNGIVWTAGSKINSLFRLDPKQEKIESYPIREAESEKNETSGSLMVWTMVQDNNGFIWFSQLGTKSIWKFDPNNDKFSAPYPVSAAPFQMKIDNLGNIWFTTLASNTIGVMQKIQNKSGEYKTIEFNVGNDTMPAGLFLENNDLWVAEIGKQKIANYHVIYDNGVIANIEKILEVPASDKITLGSPTDLFVVNNTVWLTEHGTSFITEYQLDSKNITRFPTSQNTYGVTTLPFWIREINDGRGLWINEHEGNKIAFFDTVNKTLTEYEIPSRPADGYLVYPLNIATDPLDGKKLWFSEWNTDKFGMLNGAGQIAFDIHSKVKKVILGNDTSKQQSINIEITKNNFAKNSTVFLNASSSISPNAGLGNLRVTFSDNVIDLTRIHQVQLLLRNNSVQPGNYTLGISASDGIVTKTIFIDMEIQK